jgi:amino-acid N-acetyltransferase
VERSHIIPFAVDGSLLLEVYVHDGIGTMVVDEKLESLREATPDDVGGILQLIEPFEKDGTLVKRTAPRSSATWPTTPSSSTTA